MYIKKIIALILFTLVLFLTSTYTIRAEPIYSDNFDDGNSDGWIISYNTCSSEWQVNNYKYGIIINGGCVTETIPQELSISPNINYSFEVKMTMPQSINMDRNFVFKYQDHSNWYGIHTLNNNLYLHKVVNGTEYFLENWHTNYNFLAAETYDFKIDKINNRFDVYINNVFHISVPNSGVDFDNQTAGLQASAGGSPTSEVWFDNVVVTELPDEPEPEPTVGPFELPFNYEGRPATQSATFANEFWQKATAVFDHTLKGGVFKSFTGVEYKSCTIPLSCYDSHNGTDFDDLNTDGFAYSVDSGRVVYTSPHTSDSCTPEKGGFGCVVIVSYQPDTYALYAHLDKILVETNDEVDNTKILGKIGKTGCPSCGTHLHLGVLKPADSLSVLSAKSMTKKNWQDLIYQIKPTQDKKYKPMCTYKSTFGTSFNFIDPSGWNDTNNIDPWSLPRKQDGCGVNSPYLWKYNIL